MSENTRIEWADHTFNPWIGCTRIGPGCDHCYAERLATQRLQVPWGAGEPRKLTSAGYWRQPLRWNKRAEQHGVRARVFCASLGDVFDNEANPEWRDHLWSVIRRTPCLDWILVTKRIGNAAAMLPDDWDDGWPHVWLLATICNQLEADRDIPKLLRTPACIRGVSMEPLLGPVDMIRLEIRGLYWLNALTGRAYLSRNGGMPARASFPPLDWVIVGGESGPQARPMRFQWAEELWARCHTFNVPFFFKQWGGKDKKVSGRMLAGRTWDEYPRGMRHE